MKNSLDRISYVEDEPDIRAVAELALTKIGGFTLDICANGAEAIERTPEFMPDLILLDVMMPGIDGKEVLKQLQKIPETARTPIIFMTAKAQRHEVEAYKALGAIDVIPKPFDPLMLSSNIRKIWSDNLTNKAA